MKNIVEIGARVCKDDCVRWLNSHIHDLFKLSKIFQLDYTSEN